MSDDNKSGPAEAVKGVVEGAKGLAKEAVGSVVGNKDLEKRARLSRTRLRLSVTPPRRKPKLRQLAVAPKRPRSVSKRTRTKPRTSLRPGP